MFDWTQSVIEAAGYAGVVILMVLENVFPPIPSEVVMPFAGFMTARGPLSLLGVTLAGTAGSVLGALPLYYVGRRVGEERLRRWADQHGHWLLLSGADVERSGEWFRRHGAAAVLLGRLVPGVRSLISVPAGVSRMGLAPFLALTAIGTGAWAGLLAVLGRLLGQNYEAVGAYLGPVSTVVLGGLLAWYVVAVVRLRRRRARA